MTTASPPGGGSFERRWQQALDAGPSCVPLVRLGESLTAAEQSHVSGCARCQTELELFAAFEANAPVEGEGLAVPWITAETRRRLADAQAGSRPVAAGGISAVAPRRAWTLPSWALLAASLAVVVGGAALLVTPNRPVDVTPGEAVYRGARVELTSPVGDVDRAPEQLTWTAVPGAARYDVRLLEVDGTDVWRTTVSSPEVTVPATTRAVFLPAKTLLWRVEAADAAGRIVATSGDVRLRVQRPAADATGR